MTDADLRALERLALAGDAQARVRLERALQRSGAVAALEQEIEAALARVQRPEPDGPCRATLHRIDVADVLREVAQGPISSHFRGVLAELGWPPSRMASVALGRRASEEVSLVALGRAEAEPLARALSSAGAGDLSPLRALAGDRFALLEVPSTLASAWSCALDAPAQERAAARQTRQQIVSTVGDLHARGLTALLEAALLPAVTHAREVQVVLADEGECLVRDDGPPLEERVAAGQLPLATCAALCAWQEVESWRDGRSSVRRSERGLAMGAPACARGAPGVSVSWRPDPSLFRTLELDFDPVDRRACELAHLHAGLRVSVHDRRTGRSSVHHAPGGLADWLRRLLPADAVGPLRAAGEVEAEELGGRVRFEVALAWAPATHALVSRRAEAWPPGVPPAVVVYAQGRRLLTSNAAGDGLRRGALRALRPLGFDVAEQDGRLLGLVAVQASTPTPWFLSDSTLEDEVRAAVAAAIQAWADERPEQVTALRLLLAAERPRRGARRP